MKSQAVCTDPCFEFMSAFKHIHHNMMELERRENKFKSTTQNKRQNTFFPEFYVTVLSEVSTCVIILTALVRAKLQVARFHAGIFLTLWDFCDVEQRF